MSETNTSRRFFLGGALACAAMAVALPLRAAPTLYGDGIHDDTKALQAIFDGRRVNIHNECASVAGGSIELRGGTFLFSRTLTVRGNISARDCTFNCSTDFPPNTPVIHVVLSTSRHRQGRPYGRNLISGFGC